MAQNYAEAVPFIKISKLGNQVKLQYFSQWSLGSIRRKIHDANCRLNLISWLMKCFCLSDFTAKQYISGNAHVSKTISSRRSPIRNCKSAGRTYKVKQV